MKMKRVFSSLMALGLAATLAACGGDNSKDTSNNDGGSTEETTDETATDSTEDQAGENADENADGAAEEGAADFENQTADDTLVVGVSEMNGDFVQGWTNNAHDVKARRYMGIEGNNGYSTVVQDESGQWVNNMTILEKEPETVKNDDGSETTTFTIKSDLKYSDGEPVTADDFMKQASVKSCLSKLGLSCEKITEYVRKRSFTDVKA